MSLFDRIFKRRDTEDEETSIYKESHSSKLTSFIFGFFALALTLLIAAGIFFGGRAVYRTINDNNKPNTTAGNSGAKTPKPASSASKTTSKKSSENKPNKTPSTGDNLPNTGDNLTLPKTGDPGM